MDQNISYVCIISRPFVLAWRFSGRCNRIISLIIAWTAWRLTSESPYSRVSEKTFPPGKVPRECGIARSLTPPRSIENESYIFNPFALVNSSRPSSPESTMAWRPSRGIRYIADEVASKPSLMNSNRFSKNDRVMVIAGSSNSGGSFFPSEVGGDLYSTWNNRASPNATHARPLRSRSESILPFEVDQACTKTLCNILMEKEPW